MKLLKMWNECGLMENRIYDKAIECGYDNCGIIPLSDLDIYEEHITERIDKIPESAFVYGFKDSFTNLSEIYPWAKSVIICTIWLGRYKFPDYLQGRYAKSFMLSLDTVPDSDQYWKMASFEDFLADSGITFISDSINLPGGNLPLRQAAVSAGLGIFRKNNFFYGENGSHYALKAFIIDKEYELKHSPKIKPCSERCRLCQKACSTHALSDDYTMNPLKCISLLTTFGKGNLPNGVSDSDLATWIFGCDACQDICPHNRKHDWSEGEDFPGLDDILDLLKAENILKASDEELCEKIIPKSDFHMTCRDIDVLRLNAKRSIENEKGRD